MRRFYPLCTRTLIMFFYFHWSPRVCVREKRKGKKTAYALQPTRTGSAGLLCIGKRCSSVNITGQWVKARLVLTSPSQKVKHVCVLWPWASVWDSSQTHAWEVSVLSPQIRWHLKEKKKKRGAELCAANKGLDLSLFLCIKGLRAQAWATNETVRTPR